MNVEELKNDCNFMNELAPEELIDYMRSKACSGHSSYVRWITVIGDETVVLRTFAYRNHFKEGFQWTEVERRAVGLDWAARKNIYYTSIGGYHPVYTKKTVESKGCYYGYGYEWFLGSDFDKWLTDTPMGLWGRIINLPVLFTIEKYKYCGYSCCDDLIFYLNMYEQYPEVEYFGKLRLRISKSLINKVRKEKAFAKFLIKNTDKINQYGPSATIYAYDHHIGIKEAADYLAFKRLAYKSTSDFYNIKQSGVDRVKLYRWIKEHFISIYVYKDYFEAISRLGYDLKDTKNLYPRDMQAAHDLRTMEYGALKEKLADKENRKMNAKIKKVAKKYAELLVENDDFMIVLPEKVSDFKREGSALHHCVGRMGYDKKMADGKCVIAFIRMKSEPQKPFVTVEWLTDKKIIAQCYAEHDSRPAPEVVKFVDEWGKKLKEAAV